tara:strand:+ start:61 stop:252 length:192 start_codon:yes stop_codon:yes gene_type:complete
MRTKEHTPEHLFAEACLGDTTMEELQVAISLPPDSYDMVEFGITSAAAYYDALRDAVEWMEER